MSYRDKSYETMTLEFRGPVAIVRFNRPDAMNAANVPMSFERLEIYEGLSADHEVRAVIITGSDKAYCAGGDLAAFVRFDSEKALEFAERGMAYQKVLMDMPKPTIAAVAGYAFGGGMENVLLCDLRIAAENAKFALPEINVGIFPGGGGTQRLVQNTSICKAKEIIFFGKPIDAETALEMGIVNKVVKLENLLDAAMEWAEKLCEKAPLALAAAKRMVNEAWNRDVDTGMRMEIEAWAKIYDTKDQKEGMRAFLEKRPPDFTGT
jgi:enoyl-CoA hydratase